MNILVDAAICAGFCFVTMLLFKLFDPDMPWAIVGITTSFAAVVGAILGGVL